MKFKAWDKINKEWLKTRSGGMSLNEKTNKLEYTYKDIFDFRMTLAREVMIPFHQIVLLNINPLVI